MNMHRTGSHTALVAWLSWLALAPAPASAAPVVAFQVPLQLSNLAPEIVKARVTCWVLKKDEYVIAVKFTDVPIAGGQYAGPPVSVPVDLGSPGYAADAVGWRCAVQLVTANGATGVPAFNASTSIYKAKDGTALTVETKGTF
jgi:hypothetical protein